MPKITQLLSGPIKASHRQYDVQPTFLAPFPGAKVDLLAGFTQLKLPFEFLNGVVPTWQPQSRFWSPDWADEVHSLPIKCCLSQAVQDWILPSF